MRKKGEGMQLNLPKARIMEAPASFGKRAAAFFVDMIIIQIVLFAPFKEIVNNLIPQGINYVELIGYLENNPGVQESMTVVLAVFGILTVMYFTAYEFYLSQTIGKMLFGIYIRSEDGKQAKPSIIQIIVSNLTFVPFFPFMILWVIDPVHMLFSPKRQRFMEKISKVVVMQRYML